MSCAGGPGQAGHTAHSEIQRSGSVCFAVRCVMNSPNTRMMQIPDAPAPVRQGSLGVQPECPEWSLRAGEQSGRDVSKTMAPDQFSVLNAA